MLVDLPPGLDYNEWLASHTLALFDHINLVYGTISEFCTMTGCPDMTGPGLRYMFVVVVFSLYSISSYLLFLHPLFLIVIQSILSISVKETMRDG